MLTLLLASAAFAGDLDPGAHFEALAPVCGHDVVVGLEPGEAPSLDRPIDPPGLAVVMRVHPYGLTIDGKEISAMGGTADVEANLRKKREAAESLGALAGADVRFEGRLLFIAHPEASGSTVVQLLDAAAREGFTRVSFVAHVAKPPAIPQPPESAWLTQVREEFSTLPAQQKQAQVATRVRELTAGCEPLREVFAATARAPAELRCTTLAESVGPALAACPQVDPGDLVGVFHMMMVPPVFLTHVEVDLQPGGDVVPVAQDVPWSELIVRLADREHDRLDLVLE